MGHLSLPLSPHPPLLAKTHAAWGSLNLPSCWMWYIKSPPVTYSITKYRRSWGGGGQGLRGKDTSIRGGKRPFLPTPGQRGRLWAHAIRNPGQLCTPTRHHRISTHSILCYSQLSGVPLLPSQDLRLRSTICLKSQAN